MTTVPIADIKVGDNVREDLGDIDALTQSVALHGVIVPVTLTDDHQLIAGYRRLEAAKRAGLTDIPAHTVGEPANTTVLQVVENVARKDLSPIELAQALQALVDMKMNQREIAQQVGLQQSNVSRKLTLLKLTPRIQRMVNSGEITERIAVEIAKVIDPSVQEALAIGELSEFRIQQAIDHQERTQGVDKLTKQLAQANIETANTPPAGCELIGQFTSVDDYRNWTEHEPDEVVTIGLNFDGEPAIKVYGQRVKGAATGDIVNKARRLADAERLSQIRKAVAKAATRDVLLLSADQLFHRSLNTVIARQVARFLELDPSSHTTMVQRTSNEGEAIEVPETNWVELVRDYYLGGGRHGTQTLAAVLVAIGSTIELRQWMAEQGIQDPEVLTERFLQELRDSE